jgi:hypothetical protein
MRLWIWRSSRSTTGESLLVDNYHSDIQHSDHIIASLAKTELVKTGHHAVVNAECIECEYVTLFHFCY